MEPELEPELDSSQPKVDKKSLVDSLHCKGTQEHHQSDKLEPSSRQLEKSRVALSITTLIGATCAKAQPRDLMKQINRTTKDSKNVHQELARSVPSRYPGS